MISGLEGGVRTAPLSESLPSGRPEPSALSSRSLAPAGENWSHAHLDTQTAGCGSTSELPTGTVTFLFTDIEGSTRLAQDLGGDYANVLETQRRLLRDIFSNIGGREVGTQGDSFFVVFHVARVAVEAAVAAQKALAAHPWPHGVRVNVRMGIHTGEAVLLGDDYVGLDVHRAARISSAGHGGQILLSQATQTLIDSELPDSIRVRDLGPHRLKDLQRPERVFQVVHPDLPADFPSLRSLDTVPNNLPVQLTSFIGRAQEMVEVKRLLAAAPVVTLLGAGGAGKTRLALHVAADVLETHQEGVWLVELAPITDPALVPQTVAAALGLREPARQATEALLDFLEPKSVLLVMDNCEHLLSASADLCARLLRRCPKLRVLATSREPLSVAGEASYRVPSLSLPDPQQPPSPETINQYAAVRLFVERAVFYQPRFAVTTANAKAIAEVCRRLDGIPLALELAAARVRVLTVEQIGARLDDRFRLLTGGARTALPHHQTLRAAIDWSHDLLADGERALFRRLSVFVGGFTLDAAEGVCADGAIASTLILDLLTRLVDKSLIGVDVGSGAEARYRLLETVRQYAVDRLVESGEAAAVRTRHRDVFLALAERAEPELQGPDQKIWLDRLAVELDNLRAALEWCRTDPEGPDAGVRLAGALWWFWEVRGHWTEARQWLKEAVSRDERTVSAAHIKALNAAAGLALRQGDRQETAALAERALALSRQLGDKRGAASCLVILGIHACSLENYKQAEALGGEGLNLSQEVGDNWGSAWARSTLGLVAREQGDLPRAVALLEESLAQLRVLRHPWGTAITLISLGMIARDREELQRAAALLEEALAIFQQLGDKGYTAYAQLNLGVLASALGDHGRAEAHYKACLGIRRELQEKRGIATCLAALGCCAAGVGQFRRAAVLFGAAEALRNATGATLPAYFRSEYERRVAATSRELGETAFQTAWSDGRKMPLDQAIDFALAESARAAS